MVTKNPDFARSAGLAALRWLALGHGYDVTATDVKQAFDSAMSAARNLDREVDTIRGIQRLIATVGAERFVIDTLRLEIADHSAVEDRR